MARGWKDHCSAVRHQVPNRSSLAPGVASGRRGAVAIARATMDRDARPTATSARFSAPTRAARAASSGPQAPPGQPSPAWTATSAASATSAWTASSPAAQPTGKASAAKTPRRLGRSAVAADRTSHAETMASA